MKRVLLVLGLAVALGACASTSALTTAQVTHDAIALAQDTEANLCWGVVDVYHGPSDPAARMHCTSAVAEQIGLTDAIHQSINAQLVKALDLHRIIVAQASAGIADPTDLNSLTTLVGQILALAQQLQQTPLVQQFIAQIKGAQTSGL